jgi:integrase/recombinase XerD
MVKLTKRLLKEHDAGPLFCNTRGTAWTKNAIVSRFARLRDKLGLPKGTIAYALRHTYVTEALVNGVPIAMVAELVGHKNDRLIRSTYGHLRQKAQFMQKLAESATRRSS